jgi:hypothetical protein
MIDASRLRNACHTVEYDRGGQMLQEIRRVDDLMALHDAATRFV